MPKSLGKSDNIYLLIFSVVLIMLLLSFPNWRVVPQIYTYIFKYSFRVHINYSFGTWKPSHGVEDRDALRH